MVNKCLENLKKNISESLEIFKKIIEKKISGR